ncbi:hypothetical protein [Burkholderia ubonensis]|uniref:hypothetical protein n=1 Tax=Burkholderia ubonensis TaxID=101571 RepID=UPI000AEB1382|nr:hypothetical protein [Burkholderia ubonensis]
MPLIAPISTHLAQPAGTPLSHSDHESGIDFEFLNQHLLKKECHINRMHCVLDNEFFSRKIDSTFFLEKGDILIRVADIKNPILNATTEKKDLSVHSAILIVENVDGGDCKFKRIEMAEAGSTWGHSAVAHSDHYQMGLDFKESSCKKPDDFFAHADTYKISIPCTEKVILSENENTTKRFAAAIRDEVKFLKEIPQIYGSGINGQYNCNTFVANILTRACGITV